MRFIDLFHLIDCFNSVRIIGWGHRILTITGAHCHEDIPIEIREADVKKIAAEDCDVLWVEIGGKS